MNMQVVAFQQYGSEDVLEVMTMPRPTPKPNQVLIRVAAAGINPADGLLRQGQFKAFVRIKFPFVPGLEVAGEIEQVGTDVKAFKPGQRVYAALRTPTGGGYAQYTAVYADQVAPMPANLSFTEAAGVPLTGLTALQALRDKAQLRAGSHILINGAAGGVGTIAVQIAKAMGARVTATCSTRNITLVQSLGADHIIDYTTTDVTAAKAAYDYVFDTVNALSLNKGLRLVRRGGTFVSVNPILGNPVSRLLAKLQGRDVRSVNVQPSAADLLVLKDWIEQGKVWPVIGQVYPLAQAAEAQRYSATRRARGKLILIVDETRNASKEQVQQLVMEH